jgi:pyruvate/2-oxoglutarate dehydrogenase complex dihydrolipoamide acyltransferase (E2) component
MMRNKPAEHDIVPFPRSRQIVIDFMRLGRQQHTIHGLVEIDVTVPRRIIRERKAKTGENLSFTAFIATCLGKAVDRNKIVHAYRNRWNRLILFNEVDIATLFEIEYEGRSFPLAHVIRAANKRSFREIHEEIRAIQTQPTNSKGWQQWSFMSLVLLLPPFIRDIFYRTLSRTPHLVKEYTGTISLTSVGMFGRGGGWGIPAPTIFTTSITLGGIAERPGIIDGHIEPREYLSMTASFDHDVVDGAPATRFGACFKGLIEAGYGLVEQ